MQPTLIEMGGSGRDLLFAHANGYPPASYRQLMAYLVRDCEITALEHRPLWGSREPPRPLRWRLFVDDMLAAMSQRYSKPVWVMGHSMGGTIATLAAHRAPERFAGLILLDPVFLPERFIVGTQLLSERRKRKMPMIRRALNRPDRFDSFAAAFSFYRGKRAFQRLSDDALWDYVHASKMPDELGGVTLRYSPAWEAAVYGSAPRVKAALKNLRIPTLGLRGRESDTLRTEMLRRWAHWQPAATLRECSGGHLFPLEHPREAAELISEYLSSE